MFQLAEFEQTVTTIARLKKIDLNFRENLPRVQGTGRCQRVRILSSTVLDEKAKQQRDVQRLWMLWCEGADAHLCERSQQVPGNRDKSAIRSWTGQTKNAKEKNNCSRCSSRCKKTIGLAGCSNSQGKLRTSSCNFTDTFITLVALGTVPWTAVHLWDKVRLSGAELLQDARWETLKHCRLPSLEQVCGLAADLRAEARQAHEDDREKRMMS